MHGSPDEKWRQARWLAGVRAHFQIGVPWGLLNFVLFECFIYLEK